MAARIKVVASYGVRLGSMVVGCLLAGYLFFYLVGFAETRAADEFCQVLPLQLAESPQQLWLAEVSFSNCNTGHSHQWYSYLGLVDKISGDHYPALMVVKGRHEQLALAWQEDGLLQVGGFPADALVHFEQPAADDVTLSFSSQ